jgi:long-chain acyl-CoA synthetase
VASGLIEIGTVPGDKIASISNNRPEWNIIDMAIMQIGAIHIPIYPTISESDYTYILNHAEVKYVFVEGKELLRKIEHILPNIPSMKGVFTFRKLDEHKFFGELVELGKQNSHAEEVKQRMDAITEHDVATMIYTSGTTGFPKGVMLSHANILNNVWAVQHVPPVDHTAKAISYLPLCHVYERMINYAYQYIGLSTYYVESIGAITQDLQEIKPDIMTTVPRLLEKIYDRIVMKGQKLGGFKKNIFFWAIGLGLRYELKNSLWFNLQLKIADKLVFKKWREALGNNIKVIISGGAALQERLSRSFWAAGIPVLEGYGLTETSPVIAVSHFHKNGFKFGTVGPVLDNLTVKIADDGEILCKGPSVMKGYYKQPDLTREAIEPDGFFHTGDIGQIEPGGQLKITGRKKAMFKTSFGKYISPEHLENKLKESPFIDATLIVGENKKFAAALVVPDFEYLKNWCQVKEIPYTTNKEMVQNPVIKKRFQREIDHHNTFFGDYEKIKKFHLIEHEWSVESGELTASLKLKRNLIKEKYAAIIEALFL